MLHYILVIDASPSGSFPTANIDPYEQYLLEERTTAKTSEGWF